MTDMQTMPIRELTAEIRATVKTNDNIAVVLLMNVLCNRLDEQQDIIEEQDELIAKLGRGE